MAQLASEVGFLWQRLSFAAVQGQARLLFDRLQLLGDGAQEADGWRERSLAARTAEANEKLVQQTSMLLGRNIRRSCFGLLTRYQLPIWSDIVYSEIMGWIFPIFMFSGRWNSLQWGEELRQWHSDGPSVTRLHKRAWLKSVLGRLKDKFCLSTESCLRSNFKSCYHGHFSEEKLTNEAICWLKKCSTNRNR